MSKQSPVTVRLTNKASRILSILKAKTGRTKQDIVERALESFERGGVKQ